MRTFPWNHPLVRSTGIGILLLSALSLPYSQVLANPPGKFKSPPTEPGPVSVIAFEGAIPKTVCAGQQIALTAIFAAVPGRRASTIEFFSSSLNTIAPDRISAGVNDGPVGTSYVAKNAGDDEITVVLNTTDDEGSASSTESVKDVINVKVLKECKYHFNLHAEMNTATTEGGAYMSLRYVLDSEGDLIARDPTQPLNLESKNAAVDLEVTITGFQLKDCTINTTQPGNGFGHLDATTEPVPGMQDAIHITLGPVQDFFWKTDASGSCGGESSAVHRGFSIPPSTVPLTGFLFVLDGGSVPVKVSFFEEGQKILQEHGSYAQYTATLTLKRVEGE